MSFPQFDVAVPAARDDSRGVQRVPVDAYAHVVMYFDRSVVLLSLPIPEPELAFSVARGHELAIWAASYAARVPLVDMAREDLLLVLFQASLAIVDHDSVIKRLPKPEGATRMQGCRWNGVHIRLAQMLCHHRDPELPEIHLLVV